MSMKTLKTVLVVLAISLLGVILTPGSRADELNKKTVLTFSQPVEIPGQVLPAGTYTFKLMDSPSDRHIVQIFNEDGSQIIATVLAINNYRLQPTSDTVVKFAERSGDKPEALKAWFYPGNNFGQEFVYPKQRAIQLATTTKEPVPALTTETIPADLTTVPIVAVTPEQKMEPVSDVIQTTPPFAEKDPAPMTETKQLPKTASPVPLIALLGLASLGFAFALKRFAI
jgi:hypothetical protein